MARNIGPQCRLCRSEGVKLYLKGDRCKGPKCPVTKKRGAPGKGPRSRTKKVSDYGVQLREKQKLKRLYGMLESQFRLFFSRAVKKRGVTGETLIQMLERRLDNVVYRMHLAPSRKAARQLVLHGHIRINGKRVSIPSMQVRENDEIAVLEKSTKLTAIKESLKEFSRAGIVPWLEMDPDRMVGKVRAIPRRSEVTDLAALAGNHQVTLTWTDPTSQNLSHIEITHDRTGGAVPLVIAAGVERAVLIGLTNDVVYTFGLRTVSAQGARSLGAGITGTPAVTSDVMAPAAVAALAAVPGDREIALSWIDPADADLNHIEITHDQAGGSTPIVIDVGVQSAVLSGLVNDTAYTFTVVAVDHAGNASGAATDTATPFVLLDTMPPADVTGLEGTPGSGQVALTWVDPTDPDLNHIEITHTGASGGTPIIIAAGVQTATVSGLAGGVPVIFTVRTVDDSSNASTGAKITRAPTAPDTSPPAEVTGLDGIAGSGQVTLTWVDPADADLNHIEITHTSSGGTTPIIIAEGVQIAVVNGLANGVSVTFMVKTVDTSSNKSNGVQTTDTPTPLDVTAPQPVTGMAAVAGNGQVTLSWVDPADSDFNHVEITHNRPGGATPRVVGYGVQTALIGGLRNNDLYTFTLVTVDTSDNSSAGVTIDATPTAGGGDVTITLVVNTPTDQPITFTGALTELNKLAAQEMYVEVDIGATTHAWYLDGDAVGVNSNLITVSSSTLSLGYHVLTVVATKGGLQYSAQIGFLVVNS